MRNILLSSILKDISGYYTNKIITNGPNHFGVDWNSKQAQFQRFKHLSKIINTKGATVNDIGCGYGAYIDFSKDNFQDIKYKGYDLSYEMICFASKLHSQNQFKHISNLHEIETSDYSIASGLFNVMMQYDRNDWFEFIINVLEIINVKSTKGFSFNILSKKHDAKYRKHHLYYADPEFFHDYCKNHFSRYIDILEDPNLFEFTILVNKK